MKEVNKTKKRKKITLYNIKLLIKKYFYMIYLFIPFLLIDIITRILGSKINFYGIIRFVPLLFTLIWISLIIFISINIKNKIGKKIYITSFILSIIIYLVNNIYYSMTSSFFDFSLLGLFNEGSSYFLDAIINCNIFVYIGLILILFTFVFALKKYPNIEKTNKKNILTIFLIFILIHAINPLLLGGTSKELTWSTWRNPRSIYINYNDNNKSMMVSGIYEYSIRNFYINFLKIKKDNNEEELNFLEEEYSKEEEHKNNFTAKYKDKNLIIVQLEGTDDWLITEENTPTIYNMKQKSINFTNHYSYYNGGGSTFNSEFAVNTGFITPLSYKKNAYSFNKNSFPYSMAKLFKKEGYAVNTFHMNNGEYYSRATNYKNWGYDHYYGLQELGTYKDDSYILDRELILNETFNEKLFSEEKFVDYIIAYSGHLPFSTEKGVCKKLIEEDKLKELNLEELPDDYILPTMTEEECAFRQAKETDYMINLLVDNLKEKDLLDKTVIVIFTDHYLYTLSDQTILAKYKETSNNLINHTPFFIWDNDTKKTIKNVTSQLNILPTLINLFGLENHPNYYIGTDALDPNYKGIVFFSDYSWYDGNAYTNGGIVTNNAKIEQLLLEDKNHYINHIIRKNDLTLKYDYFSKKNKK